MDDQELLQMMVAEPWDAYRRADWRGKLDLLRHNFSMHIAHADKTHEFLHIVLDGHTELEYMVNKAEVWHARFDFSEGQGYKYRPVIVKPQDPSVTQCGS